MTRTRSISLSILGRHLINCRSIVGRLLCIYRKLVGWPRCRSSVSRVSTEVSMSIECRSTLDRGSPFFFSLSSPMLLVFIIHMIVNQPIRARNSSWTRIIKSSERFWGRLAILLVNACRIIFFSAIYFYVCDVCLRFACCNISPRWFWCFLEEKAILTLQNLKYFTFIKLGNLPPVISRNLY